MLTITEIGHEKFRLTQTIFGWNDDRRTHWYYDTLNMLASEKPDFPDSMLTRNLTVDDVERFFELLERLKAKDQFFRAE